MTDDPEALRCEFCGERLAPADDQQRLDSGSAWIAPEVDPPTACLASASGHTPAGEQEQRISAR